MKCPKCGYLGFETTDRCRNCQYDFSLAPFSSEPDLSLNTPRGSDAPSDFDLPPIKRQTDKLSATALDLDRLFGTPDPAQPDPVAERPPVVAQTPEPEREPEPEPPSITLIDDDVEMSAPVAAAIVLPEEEQPAPVASIPEPEPLPVVEMKLHEAPTASASPVVEEPLMAAPVEDEGGLPFDDAPIMPPAARTPLAVRRSTPEVPRNRPRTTRPVRMNTLDLEPAAPPKSSEASEAATETVASLMESPSLGSRIGAGAIDLVLLGAIDFVVLYLTLRVTGLQNTMDDLRVLPLVPFIGFLMFLAFGYVASFTVAGGQTIGKMALSLRVIGDDGRPVDAAGGMLRALGCMLVPVTLGLSYLPALFTSDHRALHDRLAGTRVVQE